jgi:hypothetical protein
MNWHRRPSADSLQELLKYILSGTDIKVQNCTLICKHPCRQCHFIVEILSSLIKKEPCEKLSFSNIAKPNVLCVPTPDRGCPVNSNMKYSRAFLHELSGRSNLYCNGDYVYSKNAWALYRGGLNKKVVAILEMLGVAADPDRIWSELCPYLDEPVPIERVHSALINAEDSHIWGRGEFIHKDHININGDVLPSLKDILLLRLRNTPFLALHGVFTEFRTTFGKAGIPNEYALSTVIALFLEEFHVDRYRYVYMKKPSKSTSIDEFIEKWIQEQGGEVERDDLDRWMMEQVGVRQSVVQLSLGRLNSVVVTRKGYLTHIDNTGLTPSKLLPLYRWIQSALEQHEHIGINKLYKEQQVTCFQLQLTSKNMLYAVLRYFFSTTFDFIQYPHITRQDQDTFNTLGEALSEYIKQQKGIVVVADCVQHFEAKGYSPDQLRARIYCLPKILPYYPGCIVHEETIGWNNQKAGQLYNILLQAYTSRIKAGYLLGDLENAFDLYDKQLPELSNDMNWTNELISAIASQYDDINIIGNMKRAYSVTCYEKAIHTLDDLVVKVVRDQFSGGCSREQMNEWMQDNGVIRKQLTANMFSALAGLVVTEYEYLWEGESHE